ncbi:glycosyltransferase [Amycolatopsis sp. GM8]|uniref:glycosyltransferase n=1 Tax=Amycolatopsis sp. GM8 TaxID=2896530 RepID=UPI001F307C47|nr:glycosyltransferase [Amycolatopsis sp. GM8]
MRILFTFVGGSGHFHPLLPIARAAAAHTVAFACPGRMTPSVEAAGFPVMATSKPRSRPGGRSPLLALDPRREERDLREHFARTGARTQAEALLGILAEWKPDVVVRDEMDFGAAIATERLGIPCATVICLAAGGFLRPDVVAEPLHELRTEHGLPPDPDLAMLTSDLVFAPFPPSFRDPGFPLPANVFSFRPNEPVTGSGGDAVYFTLGTEFNTESGDLFTRVLTGLRDLPNEVVATVGASLDPAEFGPQPPHVRVERYVPQGELLPRCAAVVSHGGSGSVLGALAHGVPSVLLPMGADQPHNARRVAALGAGLALDPTTVTPADIRAAVTEVIGCRQAAAWIRDENNALPGPEATVPLLESLA